MKSHLKSEKKIAQIKCRFQAKTVINKYVDVFWCEKTTKFFCFFFTGRSIIMDYGLVFWLKARVWSQICGLLTLLVDYCNVFICCLDFHSDGTHSLQRIRWWESDVMLHFSKSVLMKKQTHLNLRCSEDEYIFSIFSFWGQLFHYVIDVFERSLGQIHTFFF